MGCNGHEGGCDIGSGRDVLGGTDVSGEWMYGFAFVCGWALTAALIALVWINSRPNRRLPVGLLLGAVAGVLWPITLWIAVGAWIYRRASLRAGNAKQADAASLEAQAREADAFARQATLENMPSSASYWRAEAQRLTAQREAAGTASARPASTGRIVIGCTVASLVTIGAVGLTAPSVPVADAAGRGGPIAAPPRPDAPSPRLELPQPRPQNAEPERTELGNVAKQYGETASVLSPTGEPVVEFVVGEPGAAQCNPFAGEPQNGRFIALPMTVRTHDDPNNTLTLTTFAMPWEFVGTDGRSVEASTMAAGMCAFEAPSQLGPNRTYEFSVVLDVPAEPGVLVLRSLADRGGWEWPYQG